MKARVVVLTVLALLLIVPLASGAAIGPVVSPADGRTYPYSTGLLAEVALVPGANISTCSIQLTWDGDVSTHPDDSFPAYTYDADTVSCTDLVGDGVQFDVDFDGNYTLNATVWNIDDTVYESQTSDFYVDRSEISGSKVIGAMLFPFLVLFVLFILFIIAQKLPDTIPNNVFNIISILFSCMAVLMSPLIISNASNVLREFVKNPLIAETSYTTIVILQWVAVYIFVIMLVIRVFLWLFQQLKEYKFRGRKVI